MKKERERVRVQIDPRHLGGEDQPNETQFDLEDAIEKAAWDDLDPGQGKAVLLADGREVLNPVPMAPPVGHTEQPSMFQIMERMIAQHYAGLQDRDIEETEEESQDFDVAEDEELITPFEIVMMDDFPGPPPADAADPPAPPAAPPVVDPPPEPSPPQE